MATHLVTRPSTSSAQTESIAAELAATLAPGDCIALIGELGAGKTQFVRGLVIGLSAPARQVCSPTFMLLNVYPGGRLTVYHLDAYRVAGPADFESIGFPELLDQGGLVAVEWANRIESLLPQRRIVVTIQSLDETTREISIERPL